MQNKITSLIRENRDIVRNTIALVSTTMVTSGTGFLYWWVVARVFPQSAYGLGSAMISAMMLMGNLGMVGMANTLILEYKNHRGHLGAFIMTGLMITAIAGAIFGVVFAIGAPLFAQDLSVLASSVGVVLIFAAGVALTSSTAVLDSSMLGLLRGELQFLRNSFFSVGKLLIVIAVVAVVADRSGLLIYVTWAVGNLISVLLLAGVLRLRGEKVVHLPRLGLLRGTHTTALSQYALDFAILVPGYSLPLIVTSVLSAEQNAYFYTSWMLATFLFMVPSHMTSVLFVIGSRDLGEFAQKMSLTLRTSFGIGLLGVVGTWIIAQPILSLFGPSYGAEAWVLRIIVLASFPLAIKSHFITAERVHGKVLRATLIFTVTSLIEVVAAGIGAKLGGLNGLASGWLIANLFTASIMVPTIISIMRSQRQPMVAPLPVEVPDPLS